MRTNSFSPLDCSRYLEVGKIHRFPRCRTSFFRNLTQLRERLEKIQAQGEAGLSQEDAELISRLDQAAGADDDEDGTASEDGCDVVNREEVRMSHVLSQWRSTLPVFFVAPATEQNRFAMTEPAESVHDFVINKKVELNHRSCA